MPGALERYVGIPFAEHGATWDAASCWGLVCLYYREEFGITLPTYDEGYVTTTDRREVAALFAEGMQQVHDWARTDTPAVGDVVLFRVGGATLHCGLWITPDLFLHCERGTETCLSRHSQPKWKGRCVGVYRHRARRP